MSSPRSGAAFASQRNDPLVGFVETAQKYAQWTRMMQERGLVYTTDDLKTGTHLKDGQIVYWISVGIDAKGRIVKIGGHHWSPVSHAVALDQLLDAHRTGAEDLEETHLELAKIVTDTEIFTALEELQVRARQSGRVFNQIELEPVAKVHASRTLARRLAKEIRDAYPAMNGEERDALFRAEVQNLKRECRGAQAEQAMVEG